MSAAPPESSPPRVDVPENFPVLADGCRAIYGRLSVSAEEFRVVKAAAAWRLDGMAEMLRGLLHEEGER